MNKNVDMKKIDETLASMTTEQKLGHLVICRAFPSTVEKERDYIFDKLRRGCIGALQAPTDEEHADFAFEAREASPLPLLICADMESGFPRAKRKLPPQLAISAAALNDESLAYEFGRITAIEAKAAGFNLVWGPVVDLIGETQTDMIQRKLGADPYLVARIAGQIAKGYADEGMFYTAKHCPCGCDATKDSHLYANNNSMKTAEELLAQDLIPYVELLKNDMLIGIMTNHMHFPKIDPEYPTTLSPKLVSLIRSIGFDGLLMTDSLGMVGIINRYGEDACIGKSIQAGHDIIIPNYRIPYQETMERLENAYNNGVITPERLDEAVRRVLVAQQLATGKPSQKKLEEKDIINLNRLNSDSVCAVTDEGVSQSIDPDKTHLFVILTENLYKNSEGEAIEVEPVESWNPDAMQATLEEFYPNSKCLQIAEYPSRWHMHDVSYLATQYDDVVFLTFCKGVPYGMHDRLHLRLIRLMDAIQAENRIAAVVHSGNPISFQELPHIPRIIVAFSGGECEKYALEVLMGKRKAVGKMPIKLKLK